MGISSLLEAKIANLDDRIHVIDTLKLENVSQYDFSGVDALITTHFIDKFQVPDTLQVMEVSPLLVMKMLIKFNHLYAISKILC